MIEEPYSVLVVDDSALMRNLVGKIFDGDSRTKVVGKAMNGRFALQKIDTLQPEVIVLDLEMPEMNGIQFLTERKKRGIDIPVVVLSSLAHKGAKITMEALALGASEFVLKPSGSVSLDVQRVAEELLELAVNLGAAYRRKHPNQAGTRASASRPDTPDTKEASKRASDRPAAGLRASTTAPPKRVHRPDIAPGPVEVVAIGISTGGPNALRKVFAQFPASLDASVVIVQHMPAGFTMEFARSLDKVGPMNVREAVDGEPLVPGVALVCPGDYHLAVVRDGSGYKTRLSQDPPRNGHRPSADVLFQSIAATAGRHALGVIMTGMGKDGARELGSILQAGGYTIGQDGGSSVVYGMPRVAFELGHVERQVSLHQIADTITELVAKNR